MFIKSVKIYGFGKHINREFELKNGLNVIYGDNEAGKSTLLAFIRAMLYGLTGRGEDNYRKKYMPWEKLDGDGKAVKFGGELVFESGGLLYHEVCVWGASKREDICSLCDFYSGRPVRVEPGRSVGEQLLKLTADAFDSSVYIGQLASSIKAGGDKDGVLLARLSALSGFDESETTGTAAGKLLKEKMDELKAPRGKNGELDRLVIKKLSMKNELTRLSETDNKISAQKEKLDGLFRQRDALLKSAADYERLIKTSKAARLLLTKDKMMTVFSSIDGICSELEECRSFNEKHDSHRTSLSAVITGIATIVVSAAAISLPFIFDSLPGPAKYALIAGGGAALIAAIILLALKRSDKKKYMLKNGVKIDVEQRIEELEETLSQKEVLIQSYLDGHTIEEMHEIWRGAEKLLKDSSEDERRYAISRPAAGFEEGLSEIHAKLEPVLEKIGYIQSGIDNLRASSGVSFTEANDALNGIDAEIDRLANLYKAYELAAEVLEESMNEIRTTLCPRLCSDTENIFERITGRRIHVKISDDFTISVYDEDVPRSISSYSGATVDQAYFSLRLAIARMLAPKNECYPVMLDDSFVQYDDERMANGLGFLADYARSPNKGSVGDDASGRSQIIFVTCQRRAADIAGDTVIAI